MKAPPLELYTNSHRAVARYSVFLKEHFGEKAPCKLIQPGLHCDAAISECDRLNKTLTRRGFGSPCYAVILENSDEARRAVRVSVGEWEKNNSLEFPTNCY